MTIGPFKDTYRWLSNFWEAPIVWDGLSYATNEHFYQSFKTIRSIEKDAILAATTPFQAKRLGLKVTLRNNWDDVRIAVMMQANLLKYSQHSELLAQLLATDNESLVEFNTWHDNFWGNCCCAQCSKVEGLNHLGKVLENTREALSAYPVSLATVSEPSLFD